ncbi:MAG TPA: CBS domain-containing protein [Anaeromyxobacteraceae bacterium]|nr:CBS domain-containing protein [Anaeromyxobacteraceae bacterium]
MACIANHVVRSVISLDESATCAEAASLMAERGIGSVGVRAGGRLVGIATERDLLASAAAGRDPAVTPVLQALPDSPAIISSRATEREAAERMRVHRTRHLAVVEGGEIVGVLSLLDLVSMVVEEKQWSIDQLESYIRGGRAAQLSSPSRTIFAHPPAPVTSNLV